MKTITVDYGYDVHSIEIDGELYQSFLKGEDIGVDGQGFVYDEEGWQQDHWFFDGKSGEVTFTLDNGAEFFAKIVNVE